MPYSTPIKSMHTACILCSRFVDAARPPTAYSRTDSACHTNTTVHISLTAWLLNLLTILMPACLAYLGSTTIHRTTIYRTTVLRNDSSSNDS